MEPREIDVDRLLLDPNNYRLQEIADYTPYPEDRFQLEAVQSTTLKRLQKESIKELQASIMANGFLAIERIVVTKYDPNPDYFLVIEGNRRVAALKAIKALAETGAAIPDNVAATLKAVPCIVASEEQANIPYFKETLMGIRHVGGIKQWGGYQRAKLIADLRDIHGVEPTNIAERLGLSVQEVNRRYRALKALQQMQESEEFGEYATPLMYPLFHEAVSQPAVREWLEWNAQTSTFNNDIGTEAFYRLITPRRNESGAPDRAPKLKSYSDVRDLKHILGSIEARRSLFDEDKELVSALSLVKQDSLSRKWKVEIAEANAALKTIGAIELSTFGDEEFSIIQGLIDTASQLLEIRRNLARG